MTTILEAYNKAFSTIDSSEISLDSYVVAHIDLLGVKKLLAGDDSKLITNILNLLYQILLRYINSACKLFGSKLD